jgi:hypothetical protein
MSAFEDRVDSVIGLFRDLFRCPGRTFGHPPFGVADGVEGVQWNAWCRPQEEAVLGVNLEGMKYDDWPVARLIEREIADPLLLTEYRDMVERPELVTVNWQRDAWQGPSRPQITESRLLRTTLDQLDDDRWERALRDARECLDPERDLRGRRRAVTVTLEASGQKVERDVSPHLQFWNPFCEDAPYTLQQAKKNLEPLHEWATHRAEVRSRGVHA